MYWLLFSIIFPFIQLFYPTKIIGKRNLKQIKNQPSILACNHQTNADAFILKAKVDAKMKMMAKASLFKSKAGNWFFRTVGAYPVKRGENDITAVKTTISHLKQGKHILIFPEGTRLESNEQMELKRGLATFALKTDSYIIPMIFRKKTKVMTFNTLLIGEPFKFSDMVEFKDKKIDNELIQQANEILSQKMKYLKEVNIKEYKKQLKNKDKNNLVQ